MNRYRITIDPDNGFIVTNFGGQLIAADMLNFIRDLYSHEDYNSSYPTVYDFKLSSAIGYRIDVISFVEHLKKLNRGSKKRRIALIVGSINQRFLLKTFMVLIKGLNFDVEMFDNEESCLKWIVDDNLVRNKIESSISLNRAILYDQLQIKPQ